MIPVLPNRLASVVLLVVPVLHLAAVPAAAQDSPKLSFGDEIRVTIVGASPREVIGTFTGVDIRSVTLVSPEGDEWQVPIESVSRLARLVGKERKTGTGAVIGLAGGAVAGALIGVASDPHSDCSGQAGEGACPTWLYGAVILGAAGAGIGALVGQATWGDVWEELPLTAIRSEYGSPGRGLALAIGWRFPIGGSGG